MKKVLQFISICYLLSGCGQRESHNSDLAMIENFHNNRDKFEKLVSMVYADTNLCCVNNTSTTPNDLSKYGINQMRISEYRQLLSASGVPHGFNGFHKNEGIRFIATTRGFVTSGSSKGYTFRFIPPYEDDIVDSIDGYNHKNRNSFWIYRYITTNWYLFYEYND